MVTIGNILLLVGGLLVLWKCADVLVSGSVSLADKLGVTPLVIGLTIVAMGTSAPEVATSVAAATQGDGSIAIGNVYGSNIANLALVGGIAALIAPITVGLSVLRREMPVMVITALLLFPFLYNNYLSRVEGIILLAIFALLIFLTIYLARKEARSRSQAIAEITNDVEKIVTHKSFRSDFLFITIGLIGLAGGAKMTLIGAVEIGRHIGLSETVIALTIIAIGTSLPELVTSVVAAMKGHDDLSVGNLVGSNVFNTLLVTGTAGIVKPFQIAPRLLGADYWIMVAVSVAFVVIAMLGKRVIGRIGGLVLLCGYIGYMVYLFAFTAGVG